MSRKWQIVSSHADKDIIDRILENRGIKSAKDKQIFLNPPSPLNFSVGINPKQLALAITRIKQAIQNKESIVVYADYDADGITAGAIMWETLWQLGGRVMPYIPHRLKDGYGLSQKGIDEVRVQYDPSLIITVDHGITAHEKVAYAKKLGIEVIVTDHHVKPKKLPRCTIVHTTELSGSGLSWLVANGLSASAPLELAAIGTIADLLPLTRMNRSIVKYGLEAMRSTKRVGLNALISQAGIEQHTLNTYAVSHLLAPRLNAMGRLEHALDALRLLCTKDVDKARLLAEKLGLTNRERQKLTEETVFHARDLLFKLSRPSKKLIFLSHKTYNPGVIGLVAGRLVEEFYRPAVVLAVGDGFAKGSARSISGFNIVEAIRSCSDLLVDVGGHPMAAGFTLETKNLTKLQKKLEAIAEQELDEEKLTRVLKIDVEIALESVSKELWVKLQQLSPFGFGNPEPVFVTRGLKVVEARLVGKDGKHLKLRLSSGNLSIDAIAFGMGEFYGKLNPGVNVDVAYTVDVDSWQGYQRLQLKIKDIHLPE